MQHLLLILLLSSQSLPDVQLNCDYDCVESCPEGWEWYGTHCYSMNMEKKTGENAEDVCKWEGEHLPSVTAKNVSTFLIGKMTDWGLWIGGRRKDSSWTWSDCTMWNFTNWRPQYPDNKEHCAIIYNGKLVANKEKWNGLRWNSALWFVCSNKKCQGKISDCKNLLSHKIFGKLHILNNNNHNNNYNNNHSNYNFNFDFITNSS